MRLSLGDHLRVNRGVYWHHGIYVGSGLVVHFDKPNRLVLETTLDDFLGRGCEAEVVPSRREFDAETVAQRARSLIGSGGYDLLTNNCEHMARWCTSGTARSTQVEGYLVAGGTVACVGLLFALGSAIRDKDAPA